MLKKTLESPYTTKVNYRDRTTRGTTRTLFWFLAFPDGHVPGPEGRMTIAPAQAPPERLRYTPRVPEGNPLLGGSNARRWEPATGLP